MLRHLLKLIWKRKSRNLMLSLEILLAFVVVFAISAFALRSWQLYQMPTGFSYRDVWSVSINARTEGGIEADPQIYDKLRQSLKALPEVQEVSFTTFPVYQSSNWRTESFLGNSSFGRSGKCLARWWAAATRSRRNRCS